LPLVRFLVNEDGVESTIDLRIPADRRDVMVREAARTVAQMLIDAVSGGPYPGAMSVTVELPSQQTIVVAASLTFNIRWQQDDKDPSSPSREQ